MASTSNNPSCVDALKNYASSDPDKPAFIFLNGSLERFVITRQQLWDYCRKFAAVLKRKSLGKGDVVCNTLRNSPQRLITELGTITSGAISMNGQICFADGSDFIFSLNQGQCTAIILDPEEKKGAFDILKPRLESYDTDSGVVVCPDVPSLKYILPHPLKGDNRNTFFKNLDTEEDNMFHVDISPETVCQYMCTSGSTSFFKLVAFNSRVLIEYGLTISSSVGIKENDIYMNNRLLGWLGGYPASYLAVGMTRVIFDESNGRPANFSEVQWKMACQEKCDACYTSTVLLLEFDRVRSESEDEEVRSFKFRTVASGGGPVIKSQMEAALGHLSNEVVVLYASTEAGVTSCTLVTDIKNYEEFNTGSPVPGNAVRIVGEDGVDLPPGKEGEILIQSTQSALYYVNNPEKTAQTFQSDGWIRLGDIGKLNSRGQLSVLGRDKFAILRGTVVLYPDIIETFIHECPGVRDVAVTGVPDELVHQEICALVITQPGVQISADDIKTFCVNRLANKDIVAPVPRYFLFVESLPLNVNGKLDRNAVKSQACEMLDIL